MHNASAVGLLLFPDVDLLDVGGPYEVLLTANRLAARDEQPAPFDVMTIAGDCDPADGSLDVTAYGGLGLRATHHPAEIEQLDVLLVPGTIAPAPKLADETFINSIAALALRSELVTSVCTGAFFLGAAGLLDGHAWTTHFEDIDELAQMIGDVGARRDVRWVDDGDVITSGGLSCGIDMALHLVARLAGGSLAERTAAQIDHRWRVN